MLLTKDGGLLTKHGAVALDIKAVGEDGTIEGYGSVFNNVDSYGEAVVPGAFTASLVDAKRKGRTIKMLWQHSPSEPIGVWEDLAEDNKGLYCKGRLLIGDGTPANPGIPRAIEAHQLLKAKAMDGLSIGYRTIDAEPDEKRPNVVLLKKLALYEVSLVTFAANERARVETVKSLLDAGTLPTIREFEEFLREAGFSKTLSAAIAGKAAPHLRGEPVGDASDLDRFWLAMRQA